MSVVEDAITRRLSLFVLIVAIVAVVVPAAVSILIAFYVSTRDSESIRILEATSNAQIISLVKEVDLLQSLHRAANIEEKTHQFGVAKKSTIGCSHDIGGPFTFTVTSVAALAFEVSITDTRKGLSSPLFKKKTILGTHIPVGEHQRLDFKNDSGDEHSVYFSATMPVTGSVSCSLLK